MSHNQLHYVTNIPQTIFLENIKVDLVLFVDSVEFSSVVVKVIIFNRIVLLISSHNIF